jgi:hypothetical protein
MQLHKISRNKFIGEADPVVYSKVVSNQLSMAIKLNMYLE